MKLSLRTILVAAALLAGTNVGRAEGLSLDDYQPFAKATKDAEITFVDHVKCTGDDAGTCCPKQPQVGRDFFNCENRCGGIYFGGELLYIRPFASDSILAPGATNNADLGYRPAWRGWVGYQSSSGLGGRVRAFGYDQFNTTATSSVDLEFRYFDAELTQNVSFRRWNLLLSGGLRQAETNLGTIAPGGAQVVSGFDGVGLTFATQAARDLNASGSLKMTMGGRWSALYGNTKSGVSTGGVPATTINRDDLMNVMELNIGTLYFRELRNGSTLVFGGGLEAQYWSNGVDASGLGTQAGTDDIGFAGFTSSITYLR